MENENDKNDDNCITESEYNDTAIGSGTISGGYNNTAIGSGAISGVYDDYYEKIERERKKKLRNDKINYLLDE